MTEQKNGQNSIKDLVLKYRSSNDRREKRDLLVAIINFTRKYKAERYALGWEDTPDGFLPPEDIKAAGFIKDESGQNRIPGQEYLYESTTEAHQAGEKYLGYSEKYLRWKSIRRKKLAGIDTTIDETFGGKEINIDEIDF